MKRNDEKKNLHIQCAFKLDCEKLLSNYSKLCDFSYTAFAKVWTDMSFSLIYSGKSSYDEQRLFTESCFITAKKFLVFSQDLYVQVGALYLLYGLYYKQPLKAYVKIRMTKSEYKILLGVVLKMQVQREIDALYVFVKLKTDNVFDYTFTQSLTAPDLAHNVEIFTMKDDLFQSNSVDEIDAQLKGIIENVDVTKISEDYRKAVREFVASSGEASLLTFDTIISEELDSIYKSAFADAKEAVVKAESSGSIGTKRSQIKAKASRVKNQPRRTIKKKKIAEVRNS